MFCYSEDELSPKLKRKIQGLIGNSFSIKDQITKGVVGSRKYRLRRLKLLENDAEVIDLNSRCNFEKFERGLLLRINSKQKIYTVAINYNSITDIELTGGEECINPIPLSPMWLLIKLGMHIRYARYFMIKILEYSVDPIMLKIQAGDQQIVLDSNGYNFHGESKYFEHLMKKCAT